MRGLLVRVGADLSAGGGSWNGPADSKTGEFAYVPIPEGSKVHAGMEKPYVALAPVLARFGVELPARFQSRHMHLDPDFDHLTYGDQGERAKQLRDNLRAEDLIVFYAGLADIHHGAARLVYAIIGLFVIEKLVRAADVPRQEWDVNAHSRRVLSSDADDLIVYGRPVVSGRLRRCLPIGEYRDRAYRVKHEVLDSWGGLSVKDGYLQRSARLPRFLDSTRFLQWLKMQKPSFMKANN
jgi:hypothetical protein